MNYATRSPTRAAESQRTIPAMPLLPSSPGRKEFRSGWNATAADPLAQLRPFAM